MLKALEAPSPPAWNVLPGSREEHSLRVYGFASPSRPQNARPRATFIVSLSVFSQKAMLSSGCLFKIPFFWLQIS